VTTTDEHGTFSFKNISPGQYRLFATHPDYVRAEYGQRAITGAGVPFRVEASKQTAELRLALTPTAAISGRITGPAGDPIGNADVVAFKSSFRSGVRTLSAVRAVRTNDLGEYRLFWLTPGEYYVGVQAADGVVTTTILNNIDGTDSSSLFITRRTNRFVTTLPFSTSNGPGLANLITYFPGSIEGLAAQPIGLKAGADIRNVNISVAPIQTSRVSGIVASQGGTSPVQIRLLRSNQPPFQQYSASTDPNTGAFEMTGVIPGPYIVFANGPRGQSGQLSFEVKNDVTLSVTLKPEVALAIRIRMEDQKANEADPRVSRLRVDIVADPWINGAFSNRSTVPASGLLTASLPTGNYRVYVPPVLSQQGAGQLAQELQNIYVQSIKLGSVDVLNSGLHLDGQPDGTLEIVLGSKPATVSGRAVSDKQEPVPSAVLVLMPNENQGFRQDMLRVAVADQSGRFTFPQIVPGDYRLFAWDDLEMDAWLDPEFLKAFESRSVPLHVVEASEIQVEIPTLRPAR
jgi:protocatechuate 3,4-dioxygenase beta subunit